MGSRKLEMRWRSMEIQLRTMMLTAKKFLVKVRLQRMAEDNRTRGEERMCRTSSRKDTKWRRAERRRRGIGRNRDGDATWIFMPHLPPFSRCTLDAECDAASLRGLK